MASALTPEQVDRLAEKLNVIVAQGISGKSWELAQLIETDGNPNRCPICKWPWATLGCKPGQCGAAIEGNPELHTAEFIAMAKKISDRTEWLEPWIAEMYLQAIAAILKQVAENVETPAK